MRDLGAALPLSIPTLARVLDRSPDCVKLLDLDGRLVWMNANGMCAMEIDDFQTVAGRPWPTLWPEAGAEQVGASLPRSTQEGMATFTGFCPTAKGSERWWDVTVHPAADDAGRIVGFLSVSRDVTERENQRLALEAVIAEMRHRLKNSYTIVCGLIRALTRGNPALAEFSSELQRRITAISDAQSLFAAGNVQTGLAELVAILVEPFRDQEAVAFALEVPERIVIDARLSDAIALAVGEFLVNSAKHGAVAHGGRIEVSVRIVEQCLQMRWHERSLQPVRATSREGGQGLKIITQMLAANHAMLDLRWTDHGPDVDLRFRTGFADLAGAVSA